MLEGLDDFDFTTFAEDVYVYAAGVAVDDDVALAACDAQIFDAYFFDIGRQDGVREINLALERLDAQAERGLQQKIRSARGPGLRGAGYGIKRGAAGVVAFMEAAKKFR